jgi:hypothetical protein
VVTQKYHDSQKLSTQKVLFFAQKIKHSSARIGGALGVDRKSIGNSLSMDKNFARAVNAADINSILTALTNRRTGLITDRENEIHTAVLPPS